jgi:prepilin signal peptidase PulO-like enzyme (type II secretory pathway)
LTSVQSACESAIALLALTRLARGAARTARVSMNLHLPSTLTLGAAIVSAADWLARTGPLPPAGPIVLALAAVNAVTDLQTGFVFDAVQLAGVLAIYACSYGRLVDALAGSAAGFALLIVPYALTRGSGLGFGDVKFAVVLGAALGVRATLTAVFVAFVSAGVAAACMLCTRRARRTSSIAFAPFLSFGATWALGLSVLQ